MLAEERDVPFDLGQLYATREAAGVMSFAAVDAAPVGVVAFLGDVRTGTFAASGLL